MPVQEFKLQLGIPKEYPMIVDSQWRYSFRCHNSDGLNYCNCMSEYSRKKEDCVYYGRPIEPLAFYLPSFSDVDQQKQCPFYGILPKEIRDLIFEYALINNGAPKANNDNPCRRQRHLEYVAKVDVACTLLQTCKAIYLETYRLPMLINGYLSYDVSGPFRPELDRLAPWQFALIQRLDLSVQQTALETRPLQDRLAKWHPALRHSGAYVAPRFYCPSRESQRTEGVIPSHNFGLTTFGEDIEDWYPEDGDKVILPNASQSRDYDEAIGHYYLQTHDNFVARAMVARPLTRLTIRMSRTDWWTWTDNPNTNKDEEQLALDPACGATTRPLLSDMLALTEKRRSGQHPECAGTWGAVIGSLPDLRTFELILETFLEKKRQLEVVVECAKTWKFPIKDTNYELACDGEVEELRWTNAGDQDETLETDTDRIEASDFLSEDRDNDEVIPNVEQDVHSVEHGLNIDEHTLDVDNRFAEPAQETQDAFSLRVDTNINGRDLLSSEPQASDNGASVEAPFSPLDPGFGPDRERPGCTWGSQERERSVASPSFDSRSPQGPYSPGSPQVRSLHSPISPGYSPDPLMDVSHSPASQTHDMMSPNFSLPSQMSPSFFSDWHESATEFEVRIVRFRRQRAGLT